MLRLGIVDFDSSHSLEFTQRMNHVGVDADQWVDGARVVLGCPGVSLMAPDRIPGFARQIAACDVKLVDRPEQMLGEIDAVLILSLCGGAHLGRVRPFLEARVPAFVDKPFCLTRADAAAMQQLSRESNTLLWSSSALRFAEEILEFQKNVERFGALSGAITYGPGKRDPGNPGLFHYAIHAGEMLFTLLGDDCERVAATHGEESDVVTGAWRDGRLGTLRAARAGATAYGFVAFCERGVVANSVSSRYAYRNLCREIVASFTSGKPAVPLDTTLRLVDFIVSARDSEEQGGRPTPLVPPQ